MGRVSGFFCQFKVDQSFCKASPITKELNALWIHVSPLQNILWDTMEICLVSIMPYFACPQNTVFTIMIQNASPIIYFWLFGHHGVVIILYALNLNLPTYMKLAELEHKFFHKYDITLTKPWYPHYVQSSGGYNYNIKRHSRRKQIV